MRMRHIVICPLYVICAHYLIKDTIFEKKMVTEHKVHYMFWFPLQLLSEAFLVQSTRYSCPILMKL